MDKDKLSKEDKKIIEKFYCRLRDALVKSHNYEDGEADFEAYKWILLNTSKPPKAYFKIFADMPSEAQMKVARHLGYDTVDEFKRNFSKQLNVYRQGMFRREEN